MEFNEEQFERGQWSRLRIHVLPTKRFKTVSLFLFAGLPLHQNNNTRNALLPFVMRRGTVNTPTTRAFRERLDDMYGAGFGFDVVKRGDSQLLQFRIDIINDRFVSTTNNLLEEGVQLLGEIVTQPALENDQFVAQYVESEKENVRKRLESLQNDKIRYAATRCIAEMCQGTPYALNPLGQLEDLQSINAESLTAAHRYFLQEAALDLYVVGDTCLDELLPLVKRAFCLPFGDVTSYAPIERFTRQGEVRVVEEQLDVLQGKLNLGLRLHKVNNEKSYAATLMYNGILGGYPHSKLFVNVREKASLAYYASSRFDSQKGIGTIQSGIEIANFDKAKTIIEQQLQAMREGDISELEMLQTKAMIRNDIVEMRDSAGEIVSYDFNHIFSGQSLTMDQLLAQLESITKEDIVEVAQQVELDTVYFLRNKHAEEGQQ